MTIIKHKQKLNTMHVSILNLAYPSLLLPLYNKYYLYGPQHHPQLCVSCYCYYATTFIAVIILIIAIMIIAIIQLPC